MTFSLGLAISGFVVVMGAWISYLSTIPKMKVPVKPTGALFLQSVGIGLGALSIVSGLQGDESYGPAAFVPALFAMMMGCTFLYFYSSRKTPIGDLKVKVGDKLLPFSATASDGTAFHSDELAGKRILLKFFRGGW